MKIELKLKWQLSATIQEAIIKQQFRPSLYCVLSPKRIKFMTRKKVKCELNAAEIRSIKPNTNYGIKFA